MPVHGETLREGSRLDWALSPAEQGRLDMKFLVALERDEEGWVVADCPARPGCCSQRRTVNEALENIREAIQASLETRVAHGLPLGLEVAEVELEAPGR